MSVMCTVKVAVSPEISGASISKNIQDCPTPPPAPAIDTNDPNALCQIMIDKELAMIHAIFGTDLDQVVVTKVDNKDGWKCQSAIAKAADKCQIAKLDTYNACKKAELKAGDPSTGQLQDACMGTNGPPNHGIPDLKGKIGKKCGNGLGGTLGKKCGTTDNQALFPSWDPNSGTLGQFIDQEKSVRNSPLGDCSIIHELHKEVPQFVGLEFFFHVGFRNH